MIDTYKAAFGDYGDKNDPCRILVCQTDTSEAVLGSCDH